MRTPPALFMIFVPLLFLIHVYRGSVELTACARFLPRGSASKRHREPIHQQENCGRAWVQRQAPNRRQALRTLMLASIAAVVLAVLHSPPSEAGNASTLERSAPC